MVDNLLQLNESGSNAQFTKVYLGPSLGWTLCPGSSELIITSPAVELWLGVPGSTAYASRVILKAAVTFVILPSVAQWMLATLPLANTAAFDRSISVKDLGGNATANPITITPLRSDTIDGQPSWQMVTAYDCIQFNPLSDLSGWFVGRGGVRWPATAHSPTSPLEATGPMRRRGRSSLMVLAGTSRRLGAARMR